MVNKSVTKFPKNFLWGVSTSAHQVEGGMHNQWTVWELENAKALAARAPYQYEDIDSWARIKQQAQQPGNYVSGRATNHRELFEQDFDLVRKLNMNAFRFSIEWSRVQPEYDKWDDGAVDYYKRYIASMKRRGIEPVVTLFHFTLPVWFAEKGGFEKRRNVKDFTYFADRIITELGASVRYIITINEPEVYALQGYQKGNWPPNLQSKRKALLVINNLAVAHNRAARIIHAKSRRYKVSIAKNSSFIYPGDDSWLSVRSAAIRQYLADDYLLKKVIKQCDFIGVNYYTSDRVYGYRVHNPEEYISDMGWCMQPKYLEHLLDRLNEKYHKPIMITENGLADSRDEYREWWLKQTIIAMQRSIGKGTILVGYLHWSLLDNFEWDKGFWPRFGLFEVNYKTFQRTARPSAVWFGGVIRKLRSSQRG